MLLTFVPLSRNRYRVLGGPVPKIVKKAKIDRERRIHAHASKPRKRPVPVQAPTAARIEWYTARFGWAHCPFCSYEQAVESAGQVQCRDCGGTFVAR